MWLIIGGVLSMLIVALLGVRKQLFYAVSEKEDGVEITEEESVTDELEISKCSCFYHYLYIGLLWS